MKLLPPFWQIWRRWRRSFLDYTVTTATAPESGATQSREAAGKARTKFRRGLDAPWPTPSRTSPPILRGRIDYFRLAQVKGPFEELDGWLRRKMRCILWRRWKRPPNRATKLRQRGLDDTGTAVRFQRPWSLVERGAGHMNDAFRKA
jgi:RNA-directed DNA polymerase